MNTKTAFLIEQITENVSSAIALVQASSPTATHFSVCRLPVSLFVCLSSVTFVHPAQTVPRICMQFEGTFAGSADKLC